MLEPNEVCLLAIAFILLYFVHRSWQQREHFVDRRGMRLSQRPKFCCRTKDGMACHDTDCNNCSCYSNTDTPIDAHRIEALIVRDRKRQLTPTRGGVKRGQIGV
jgi:hypothetical protein